MTDLATHIDLLKKIPLHQLGFRSTILTIWHIATEHGKEISVEDFIKAISMPTTTKTVEPLKKE